MAFFSGEASSRRKDIEVDEKDKQKILEWITDAILMADAERTNEEIENYARDNRCVLKGKIFIWDRARKILHKNKEFYNLFYDKYDLNTIDLKDYMALVFNRLQDQGKISHYEG